MRPTYIEHLQYVHIEAIRFDNMLLRLLLTLALSTGCNGLSVIPHEREVFSVAPMMGHTNRHYHTFFRLLSNRAQLYTEMIPAGKIITLHESNPESLEELLRVNGEVSNVILQLGGRDPDLLARASAIGAEFGYDGVNLNCGCPSNAVSGRCGGASLMPDVSHVARIVENMSTALEDYPGVHLSVKHRLGVAEASTYDAALDKQKDDDEAYKGCLDFVKTITLNSAVEKLHVHGRLALLGDFEPEDSEAPSSLWVPGDTTDRSRKVDHKRVQYRAKRKARLATIKNRSVPPLRPKVVNRLAETLPHLEFVTNGGVDSMKDIHDRLDATPSNVVGCMIGRAAINHPCSFGLADTLWGEETLEVPTRGQVLSTFADYCAMEEERLKGLGRPPSFMEALRRRLVAVPFTLFVGEEGNNLYQRRIRKLISRPDRHSARSILLAAMGEMPTETLDRPVSKFSIETESYAEYAQRSGPLQRAIL